MQSREVCCTWWLLPSSIQGCPNNFT